jgi:DNA repair protein RecO (recombination protein O)
MALYRCRAVVLRTHRLGEADRIVSLLTDTRGKVRAVAKGARKTMSRLGARLEPTAHVQLLMSEGRDLDVVSQAETIDLHASIRSDLDRFRHASALLEATDLVAQERQADAELYRMLVGALGEIDRSDPPLVVAAYAWRLLVHDGSAPQLERCARCGAVEDLAGLDLTVGGVTCRADTLGPRVSFDAIRILRLLAEGRVGAVLRLPAAPAAHEADRLALAALEHHLDRRLRVGRVASQTTG